MSHRPVDVRIDLVSRSLRASRPTRLGLSIRPPPFHNVRSCGGSHHSGLRPAVRRWQRRLRHLLFEQLQPLLESGDARAKRVRVHLALCHARDDHVPGDFSHVELEPSAVAVLVVDARPRDLSARKLLLDEADGDVSRVGAMGMSATAEVDGESEVSVSVGGSRGHGGAPAGFLWGCARALSCVSSDVPARCDGFVC